MARAALRVRVHAILILYPLTLARLHSRGLTFQQFFLKRNRFPGMAGIVSRRLLRWKLHLPGSLHHQLRIFDSLSHQLCLPVSTRRCLGGDRQSTSEADVESGAVVFPLSRRVVKCVCANLSMFPLTGCLFCVYVFVY